MPIPKSNDFENQWDQTVSMRPKCHAFPDINQDTQGFRCGGATHEAVLPIVRESGRAKQDKRYESVHLVCLDGEATAPSCVLRQRHGDLDHPCVDFYSVCCFPHSVRPKRHIPEILLMVTGAPQTFIGDGMVETTEVRYWFWPGARAQ